MTETPGELRVFRVSKIRSQNSNVTTVPQGLRHCEADDDELELIASWPKQSAGLVRLVYVCCIGVFVVMAALRRVSLLLRASQ